MGGEEAYRRERAADGDGLDDVPHPLYHSQSEISVKNASGIMYRATHVLGSGDAARIVDAHVPLVQRRDGPHRLALPLRQAGILEVGDRAAGELEYPR